MTGTMVMVSWEILKKMNSKRQEVWSENGMFDL